MRKHIIQTIMVMALSAMLASCSSAKDSTAEPAESKKTEETTKQETTDATNAAMEKAKKLEKELGAPDIDLSALPEQEAYDTAKSIMENTDTYITKRIKLTGVVDYNTEDEDTIYATISLPNGDGSDSMVFEFVLHDSYVYPADYPPHEALLTMTGTYSLYNDNGSWIAVLLDGVIEPESFEEVTGGNAEESEDDTSSSKRGTGNGLNADARMLLKIAQNESGTPPSVESLEYAKCVRAKILNRAN